MAFLTGDKLVDNRELTVPEPFCVTLFLHRTVPLAELLDLHFILTCWATDPGSQHFLAGWLVSELERTPIIPDEYFSPEGDTDCILKIRRSDEDARQVWNMITDVPQRTHSSETACWWPHF